ncbi:MAG: leucyl/phenylalanyl-tRNA--protein transferase [Gammaproteobacteria bacterium]|nr:leucyl/phenylalanyl-tRNA--protein transferase [Gammaproteobacteria bacterium]
MQTPQPRPFFLDPRQCCDFPDVATALTDPDGLLAIGGDLSTARLLAAYRQGIFPWYSAGQPILWWSPNPRAVLFLDALKISRSLHKTLRREHFNLRFDSAFDQVINACASSRKDQRGTWITQAMRHAYQRLHQEGYAHSVEVWQDNHLVGGLYGISLGKLFFGESMFSRQTDASKVALVYLVKQLQRWQFALIDCQVQSAHLTSLGAVCLTREQFIENVTIFTQPPTLQGRWTMDPDIAQELVML